MRIVFSVTLFIIMSYTNFNDRRCAHFVTCLYKASTMISLLEFMNILTAMPGMCTKVSISSSSLESYKRSIRIDPIS